METSKRIAGDSFEINFLSNGITELILKDNTMISLDDSIQQEETLNKHRPDHGYLLLVIPGPGTSISKEGREYSNNNPLDAKAMAIIARSLPQKIVVNFMITVYRKLRPKYPVRLFLKREEAENWLLQH